jgi:protein tyrosine/serine phosphatase
VNEPRDGVSPPGNFRDLGGWRTRAGTLRTGRLMRGALHDGATLPGVTGEGGRVHLFDLRQPTEGSRSAPPWVCRHAWPLQDPQWARSAARTPRFFVDSALRLVPLAAAPVRDAVAVLARGDRVYVGCRLGKDRTGLILLLLGRMLEVEDAVLVEDYVRTAEEYRSAPAWVERYARSRNDDTDLVVARLEVPREIPRGILAGLPSGRGELCALLGLGSQDVGAALRALTDPPTDSPTGTRRATAR